MELQLRDGDEQFSLHHRRPVRRLRRKLGGEAVSPAHVFGAMCVAFGVGAAIGAVMTELTRAYSLAVPVTLLVIVLSFCELKAANE
jgi:uncharacterized membrane protein YoaK (UPF0700 family)